MQKLRKSQQKKYIQIQNSRRARRRNITKDKSSGRASRRNIYKYRSSRRARTRNMTKDLTILRDLKQKYDQKLPIQNSEFVKATKVTEKRKYDNRPATQEKKRKYPR